MGKPREFYVYVKKPEVRYYNSFPQVRMYDEEVSLAQLFEHPENRDKIDMLHNRKPKWIEQLGGYMLNFKGRVEVASIKNFILEDQVDGPDIMLFGKVNDSKFNLDMSTLITPLIAFGIALSSFDSRIMCE
jgi:tubby and related proteins